MKLRASRGGRLLQSSIRRQFSAFAEPFAELDTVVLQHKDAKKSPTLTRPLVSGGKTKTRQVDTRRGVQLRARHPSLEEYIELTPRLVTPVYPKYASLITSLLDLHPSAPSTSTKREPSLEILEAGTGHGGLTLYLARALSTGNPPLSPSLLADLHARRRTQIAPPPSPELHYSLSPSSPSPSSSSSTLDAYKATRTAVLHSLDVSAAHSKHARRIVAGFHRGMYFPHVDFHVEQVSEFLRQRLLSGSSSSSSSSEEAADAANTDNKSSSSAPTRPLTHVILDLPEPHRELPLVAQALCDRGGSVVVFVPSVTQLANCVKAIRAQGLPLALDRVLEVGTGLAGGREWDLREVRIRAREKEKEIAEAEAEEVQVAGREEASGEEGGEQEVEEEKEEVNGIDNEAGETLAGVGGDAGGEELVTVCRPKVGMRVAGGGFIGVWKKLPGTDMP